MMSTGSLLHCLNCFQSSNRLCANYGGNGGNFGVSSNTKRPPAACKLGRSKLFRQGDYWMPASYPAVKPVSDRFKITSPSGAAALTMRNVAALPRLN